MEKRKRISLVVFIIGLISLVAGVVFLLVNFFAKPGLRDAEFLVTNQTWIEQDSESVIWQFTEIGKGTLTTNNHIDDYEFNWKIEDNTLYIETAWHYNLENSYTYELDQNNLTLTLTDEDQTIIFLAQPTTQTEN